MSEKTFHSAYERLIHELALQDLGLLTGCLIPIPTYMDTMVCEIATDRGAFIFKSMDPHSPDPDTIATEAWVLNHLKTQGVPIPQVLYADASKQSFPSAYFIMEKAKGQPLSSLALHRDEKQAYFYQFGEALRRLHAVQLPGFGGLDEQLYHNQGIIRGFYISWKHALLEHLPAAIHYFTTHSLLSPDDVTGIDQLIGRMQIHFESISSGRLLHGDLGPLHVWVDPTSQMLTSLVDFGERMVGDPLWDFVDYAWDHVSAVWSAYAAETDPSPIFGTRFYTYALLRALPWAHKWHARGAVHVVDWLKITLTRASNAAKEE